MLTPDFRMYTFWVSFYWRTLYSCFIKIVSELDTQIKLSKICLHIEIERWMHSRCLNVYFCYVFPVICRCCCWNKLEATLMQAKRRQTVKKAKKTHRPRGERESEAVTHSLIPVKFCWKLHTQHIVHKWSRKFLDVCSFVAMFNNEHTHGLHTPAIYVDPPPICLLGFIVCWFESFYFRISNRFGFYRVWHRVMRHFFFQFVGHINFSLFRR